LDWIGLNLDSFKSQDEGEVNFKRWNAI